MSTLVWTIGHSTRSSEEFLALLQEHGIRTLVDVRRFPFSRRHPHFNRDALQHALGTAGLHYRHLEALGGRRSPRPGSVNLGWRNAGFRGYADYLQTPAFEEALAALIDIGRDSPTALMCAEAVPWRCHRLLIADALLVRGHIVRHILAPNEADPHQLTPFAKVTRGILHYPPDTLPNLFD